MIYNSVEIERVIIILVREYIMNQRRKLNLNESMLKTPSHSNKQGWLHSPRYPQTGSVFTEQLSKDSKRSRFTSNSKLIQSSLFRTIRRGEGSGVGRAS